MDRAPKEVISKYAENEAAPNTGPDSAFWQNVPPLVMETDAYGKHVPGHRTEIRCRWTNKNLYFLFLCSYMELHLKSEPNRSTKTDGLWSWDVAETFIGSCHGPIHRYKEFELSPQGEWLDLDIDLEKPDKVNDPEWRSGFEVAARIESTERVWYGWMRIPYAAIESGEAAAGNALRINFFRSQGPVPVELAWRPPLQDCFHVPEQFGILQLVV